MYRSALVTGATSGIGEAFAHALPAMTDLLLTGRAEDRLATLAAVLARPGRRVETLAADLRTDAGRDAVIAAARAFGIDLLINNAGVGFLGAFGEQSAEQERQTVEVNVVTPLVLSRALLPDILERAMQERRRGGIIIVSSILAYAGMPSLTTYAATKAFDLRLAEGMAGDLVGKPIDVLAVCPGQTDTQFLSRAGGSLPIERMGDLGRRLLIDPPERVAREALAVIGRRTVHIVGAKNRAASLALGLLPRGLLAAGGRMMRGR